MVCFVHFDFEMCFAPQRRALFHLFWPAGSAPTFRPSGGSNHWKNTVFREFPNIDIIYINITLYIYNIIYLYIIYIIYIYIYILYIYHIIYMIYIIFFYLSYILYIIFFLHFDVEMCFAPQRRALFRHRNFQKRSDHGVFCTF